MARAQFVRYVLVGLGLNGALYAMYLLLTWLSVGSLAAMTITVSIGTVLGFIANRNVIFRHRGDQRAALPRFVTAYAIVYVLNFAALWLFADRWGAPHQVVQACATIVLALVNFVMQKYWVFPTAAASVGSTAAGATL
ncbi:GtrA family protein [Mycolicibacterium sp. Dal123E01]|uniref:GtrA family protein n=1 Tax=Mycolicibacterium sp. Dal123E01 TaxID=3457578 RepID=UPI00403E364A